MYLKDPVCTSNVNYINCTIVVTNDSALYVQTDWRYEPE